MSTVEMLSVENRIGEVTQFIDWASQNGQVIGSEFATKLLDAAGETIYGHITGSNLERLRTKGVEPVLAVEAASILCDVMVQSSMMYTFDSEHVRSDKAYGIYTDEDFWSALNESQRFLAEGVISLQAWLPPKYAMTPSEGLKQVLHFDCRGGSVSPNTVRELSDNNYGLYFNTKTMGSGAEIPAVKLDDIIESGAGDKMHHLTRANHAIGQVLTGVSMYRKGNLDVVEIGPGSAATTATSLAGLSEACNSDGLTYTAFEPSADFFEILKKFKDDITKTGNAPVDPEFIHQDASEGFKDLGFMSKGTADIGAFVAGHSLHRIPTVSKNRLIKASADSTNNCLWVIGDLKANGSPINTRLLNFANNGPLNAGNVYLQDIFESQGFTVSQLTTHNAPHTVNPKLAETLEQEVQKDGHFWIAYKGVEIARIMHKLQSRTV